MAKKDSEVVPVRGSEREPVAGAARIGSADQSEQMSVTVVVRPRSAAVPEIGARHLTSNELEAIRGAAPEDVQAVEDFAREHGLTVDGTNVAARSISLSGTVGQFSEAFGVELGRFADPRGSYRGRTGPVFVPKSLDGIVQAVLGLDDRPQAAPHFRIRPDDGGPMQAHAVTQSFSPNQLAQLYQFPSGLDGQGQTIAIIELGGGYKKADLTAYFSRLGIPAPKVTAVRVDGAKNAPVGDPNSADGEVLLDINVAGAIAPKAKIAVYFTPNTTRGFYDGVAAAVHDTVRKPSVISISWGGPESSWTPQAMTVYDQLFADAGALGITICAAAGDDGSSDGSTDGKANVDFPASSPSVLACGGTRVSADAGGIQDENVWNNGPGNGATGGGISSQFAPPSYQQSVGVPTSVNPGHKAGRGVPDVAGNADPQTGYQVRVDGHDLVFGGTSAVAPLWAALVAVTNQRLGRRVGFLHPLLYGSLAKNAFRDITVGNNASYTAGTGWDACTGWGSPKASTLIDELMSV